MNDKRFLMAVRMTIAGKGLLKKKLARLCKVSRPQFSEMIHGDREMTESVKKRLILELNLKSGMEELGL